MSTLTRTTERRTPDEPRRGEPSIRPLTQSDVDASLGRAHKTSRGRAYASGCLVVVETTRYEDGRSLQTRLLLSEARGLAESLITAIAQAEEAQVRHDVRFIGHEPTTPIEPPAAAPLPPLVAGGQGRTGGEVAGGAISILAALALAGAGLLALSAWSAWGLA